MTAVQEHRRLGAGLVAFRDIALCDRADHQVALVTDGRTAYAYGTGTQGADTGPVLRSSVILTTRCAQPTGPDGDPCDGLVTWALDTEGCWGGDGDALTLLAAHGQPVER